MKNKHLVFLFLLTLCIGLAVRRAPWRNATFFQTNLLRLDTAELQQIQITLPNTPPLLLSRGDVNWSAEQGERNALVPQAYVNEILAMLQNLHSIRIANTHQPDTLGFGADTYIQVDLKLANAARESLKLGWEINENKQAATYIQLPKHEGIYLVNTHLRKLFTRQLTDFRNQRIVQIDGDALVGIKISGPKIDSLSFQKSDSTNSWQSIKSAKPISNTAIQAWIHQLNGLSGLPFADLFDESRAKDDLYAQIQLEYSHQSPASVLKIFKIQPINIPEELPANASQKRILAPYVIQSTQNPTNFFSLSDTSLLRQICHPF